MQVTKGALREVITQERKAAGLKPVTNVRPVLKLAVMCQSSVHPGCMCTWPRCSVRLHRRQRLLSVF